MFESSRVQPGAREEEGNLVLVATGHEPVERMDNDSSSMYRKGVLEGGMDGFERKRRPNPLAIYQAQVLCLYQPTSDCSPFPFPNLKEDDQGRYSAKGALQVLLLVLILGTKAGCLDLIHRLTWR